LTTEYEQLLQQMIEERKVELDELRTKKGSEKRIRQIASDIRFIEVELDRYRQGLSLFRTKNLPKVGRWGRPETEAESGGKPTE
jgi:hypothetical protein